MPQSNVVRETERSFRPPLTKLATSLQPLARQHEVGHVRIEGEQFVLIGRQAEEIGLLLGPLDRRAQRFAADTVSPDGGFRLVEISLLTDRIPAGIFAEIDIAVLLDRTPECLARALVARLGGADVIVDMRC